MDRLTHKRRQIRDRFGGDKDIISGRIKEKEQSGRGDKEESIDR